MRNIIRGLAIVIAFTFAGVVAASAATVNGGQVRDAAAVESIVTQVQYGYGTYCETLRLACENKDSLGERGEGNCRRYRQECGRGPDYCARLRNACIYKDDRGERGEGNCRRYRYECRGSGYGY